jgi:hypothetical protein
MSLLNVSDAAKVTGKHRVTIQKHIKSGKLSVSRDAAGNPQIDVAELIRVYGQLAIPATPKNVVEQQETTPSESPMQQVVEALREQLNAALERENWLKAQLETEQERNREMERRMLPPGPEEKKGFFRRLFG